MEKTDKEYHRCACCKHEAYGFCEVCEKRRSEDAYGGCSVCGEPITTKSTGLRRVFGDTDQIWKKKLEEHKNEVDKDE